MSGVCATQGDIVKHCSHSMKPVRNLSLAFAIAIGCSVFSISPRAGATLVSGSFAYRNGSPAKDRQLHLENRATGDMYVAACNGDGTFSTDVPPGLYDLRAERGVILKYRIHVEQEPINIGRVIEPVPLDVHRVFQREKIADAIVTSPAPSTANLSGRPLQALQFGHEAAEQFGAPVGTPASAATPSVKGIEAMPYEPEMNPAPRP